MNLVFSIMFEEDTEVNYIEMAKVLVKYGIEIPDNIEILCCEQRVAMHSNKRAIKDLVSSIKALDDSYSTAANNFIDTYKNSRPEIQEIWRDRLFNNDSSRIQDLAEFIAEKFINGDVIEYNEFGAFRKYTSLSKSQKYLLKTLLESKGFDKSCIIKLENYIQANFFKVTCTVKDLTGSAFEAIAKAGIIGEITQDFQFEDSSIKIAGVSSADNITN